MVAADVTRAQARVQSAAARVLQADRALRTAIITFNGNYEGLQQTTRLGNVLVLVNRPQEAVFALQLLNWPSTSTSPRSPSTTGRSSSCSTPWATRPARSLPCGLRATVLPGGHGAAGLPAPGGQRAAPGDPLSASPPEDKDVGSGLFPDGRGFVHA